MAVRKRLRTAISRHSTGPQRDHWPRIQRAQTASASFRGWVPSWSRPGCDRTYAGQSATQVCARPAATERIQPSNCCDHVETTSRVAAHLDVRQHEHDGRPGRQAADRARQVAAPEARGGVGPELDHEPGRLAVLGPEGVEADGELGRAARRFGVDRQLRSEPGQLVAAPPAHRVADQEHPTGAGQGTTLPGRDLGGQRRAVLGSQPGERRDPGRRQALVVAALSLGQGHVDARRAGALRCIADGGQRAIWLGGAVVDRRDPPAMQVLALPHADRGGVPEPLRLPHPGARLRAGDLAPRHGALDAPVPGAPEARRIRPSEEGALAGAEAAVVRAAAVGHRGRRPGSKARHGQCHLGRDDGHHAEHEHRQATPEGVLTCVWHCESSPCRCA